MNVDFIQAIKLFFANYFNFKGRSTRAEYWWVALFLFVLYFIVALLGSDILINIIQLALLIPSLAIVWRRFHDTGKSGWWYVILTVAAFILGVLFAVPLFQAIRLSGYLDAEILIAKFANVIVNHLIYYAILILLWLALAIVNLVILVQPSAPDNKYGPNPYGEA